MKTIRAGARALTATTAAGLAIAVAMGAVQAGAVLAMVLVPSALVSVLPT
jgi:asparagine N-glycosylation enzyme membrane subunit Stt3